MLLASWNVNGIRACLTKGFEDSFKKINADIFALQETKAQVDQIVLDFPEYHAFYNSAVKKGYSGVAILTKIKPNHVYYGIDIKEHDQEGRVLTLELDDFLAYLDKLNKTKPVILCGDLNVAHQEIDLKNPSSNHKNAGFSDEEREKMTQLLSHGYIDTFRYFYPDQTDAYSWWSYMFKARERNAGWRIDYFITSERLKDKLKDAYIYSDILGSDHCPVGLEISL